MDFVIFQAINSVAGTSDALDYVLIFFAQILLFFEFLILATLSFLHARSWGRMLFFDASIALCMALLVNWVIPLLYFRPRPFIDHPVVQLIFIDPTSKSFPSDHATIAFALAAAVVLYSGRWGLVLFIVACLIGLGRIAVGVHYPLDIVGGGFMGIAAAFIARSLLNALLRRSSTG